MANKHDAEVDDDDDDDDEEEAAQEIPSVHLERDQSLKRVITFAAIK